MNRTKREPSRARRAADARAGKGDVSQAPGASRQPPSSARDSAPAAGLVILDREPEKFLFAAWQNVSILVLKEALTDFVAAHPEGRSCVTVVGERVALPTDPDARVRFIDLLKRSAGQLACLAVVAESTGFARSALLSFHTSMHLAATGPSELGFLGSVDELTSWLPERHRKTGTVLDPSELGDAVRQAIDEANRR
jgi:hypothetical protein